MTAAAIIDSAATQIIRLNTWLVVNGPPVHSLVSMNLPIGKTLNPSQLERVNPRPQIINSANQG